MGTSPPDSPPLQENQLLQEGQRMVARQAHLSAISTTDDQGSDTLKWISFLPSLPQSFPSFFLVSSLPLFLLSFLTKMSWVLPNPGTSPSCISFLLLCYKLSQFQQLRTTCICYFAVSVTPKSVHCTAGFLLRVWPDRNQGASWSCCPICDLGFSSKLTCCWRNFVSCGCRTESPAFFLAGSQGLFLAPWGCLLSPATWPFPQWGSLSL